MPREPIAVLVESGLYIQNFTLEPLGAAVTGLGSSKLCCLDCSTRPAPPVYIFIPLLGFVCLPGTIVEVVGEVVEVVEVVVAAGKATEPATFFQTSFLPDLAQTYFVAFTVFTKPIFLQLLLADDASVGIAGRTASTATAIDIFSGCEMILES